MAHVSQCTCISQYIGTHIPQYSTRVCVSYCVPHTDSVGYVHPMRPVLWNKRTTYMYIGIYVPHTMYQVLHVTRTVGYTYMYLRGTHIPKYRVHVSQSSVVHVSHVCPGHTNSHKHVISSLAYVHVYSRMYTCTFTMHNRVRARARSRDTYTYMYKALNSRNMSAINV